MLNRQRTQLVNYLFLGPWQNDTEPITFEKMFSIARKQPYESLPPESPDAELLPPMQLARPSLQSRLTKVFLSFAIAIAVFGIGRWSGYSEANSLHFKLQEESCRLNGGEAPAAPKPITMEAAATTRTNCSNVVYRQEWRTLSKFQKEAYISAVNCLAKTPSVLGMNGTLYDDFPWVHNQFAHGSRWTISSSSTDVFNINLLPLFY